MQITALAALVLALASPALAAPARTGRYSGVRTVNTDTDGTDTPSSIPTYTSTRHHHGHGGSSTSSEPKGRKTGKTGKTGNKESNDGENEVTPVNGSNSSNSTTNDSNDSAESTETDSSDTTNSSTAEDTDSTKGTQTTQNSNQEEYLDQSQSQNSTTATTKTTDKTKTSGKTDASSAKGGLTPGKKAGISSGMGIDLFEGKIGWYYDWSPNPPAHDGIVAVPMLWGDGHLGSEEHDAERLSAFQALSTSPAPQYVMGFEEPDCANGGGSANIDASTAGQVWDREFKRFKDAGSLLISPSMCHQADETYLPDFKKAASVDWDITNLHINKNSMEGVKKDLDHHWDAYGKPMWVTEFACVDDQNGFTPCSDDAEIAAYINDIVELFESDDRVYAYAFSNGIGLGDKWKLTNDDGTALSAAGQVYLDAISKH